MRRPLACLIEVVQGEGGVHPAPEGFVKELRQLCDERGVLMLVDEIQTGLGRTGEWFGFQHSDVRPDIVTVAKALGNGMPIGACWARARSRRCSSPAITVRPTAANRSRRQRRRRRSLS